MGSCNCCHKNGGNATGNAFSAINVCDPVFVVLPPPCALSSHTLYTFAVPSGLDWQLILCDWPYNNPYSLCSLDSGQDWFVAQKMRLKAISPNLPDMCVVFSY